MVGCDSVGCAVVDDGRRVIVVGSGFGGREAGGEGGAVRRDSDGVGGAVDVGGVWDRGVTYVGVSELVGTRRPEYVRRVFEGVIPVD